MPTPSSQPEAQKTGSPDFAAMAARAAESRQQSKLLKEGADITGLQTPNEILLKLINIARQTETSSLARPGEGVEEQTNKIAGAISAYIGPDDRINQDALDALPPDVKAAFDTYEKRLKALALDPVEDEKKTLQGQNQALARENKSLARLLSEAEKRGNKLNERIKELEQKQAETPQPSETIPLTDHQQQVAALNKQIEFLAHQNASLASELREANRDPDTKVARDSLSATLKRAIRPNGTIDPDILKGLHPEDANSLSMIIAGFLQDNQRNIALAINEYGQNPASLDQFDPKLKEALETTIQILKRAGADNEKITRLINSVAIAPDGTVDINLLQKEDPKLGEAFGNMLANAQGPLERTIETQRGSTETLKNTLRATEARVLADRERVARSIRDLALGSVTLEQLAEQGLPKDITEALIQLVNQKFVPKRSPEELSAQEREIDALTLQLTEKISGADKLYAQEIMGIVEQNWRILEAAKKRMPIDQGTNTDRFIAIDLPKKPGPFLYSFTRLVERNVANADELNHLSADIPRTQQRKDIYYAAAGLVKLMYGDLDGLNPLELQGLGKYFKPLMDNLSNNTASETETLKKFFEQFNQAEKQESGKSSQTTPDFAAALAGKL